MDADTVVGEVGLNELLVLVLLLKLNYSSFGQGEEVEDQLLGIDILAMALPPHVFVDRGPVFLMFLHELEEEVGFLERPLPDV